MRPSVRPSFSILNWSVCCTLSSGLSVLRPPIHQISTLEKTKFYQYSILSCLISVRIQRVSLLYRTPQFADSEEFDFRVWFSAVEYSTTGILSLHGPTKFIIGLDLAVILSSPDPFWARFAIAAVQAVELKWLILNKVNKWFHSSRVKFHLWHHITPNSDTNFCTFWAEQSRAPHGSNEILSRSSGLGSLPLSSDSKFGGNE